jgi:hypothetical protein
MDQVRPQIRSPHPTTRTLDWSTYPLKPHQAAASALTPDRSTTPAARMTREWTGRIDSPPARYRSEFNLHANFVMPNESPQVLLADLASVLSISDAAR